MVLKAKKQVKIILLICIISKVFHSLLFINFHIFINFLLYFTDIFRYCDYTDFHAYMYHFLIYGIQVILIVRSLLFEHSIFNCNFVSVWNQRNSFLIFYFSIILLSFSHFLITLWISNNDILLSISTDCFYFRWSCSQGGH